MEMEILPGAYSKSKKPVRQDVQEYVTVSGKVISDSIAYQELTMDKPGKIRWVVNTGLAVKATQVQVADYLKANKLRKKICGFPKGTADLF